MEVNQSIALQPRQIAIDLSHHVCDVGSIAPVGTGTMISLFERINYFELAKHVSRRGSYRAFCDYYENKKRAGHRC